MDVQAIADNYRDILTNHYFDMRGRVGRGQFWWFVLANAVAGLLAQILGSLLFGLPLREIYALAVLLPSMSLGARRLQDTGRDGRLVWALLLVGGVTQIIGIILALAWFFSGFLAVVFAPGLAIAGFATLVLLVVMIVFWCQPGDPGPNAYGPVPPLFDPSKPVTATR
jgi:uncharacterized membrane protein YhaH (DUF805 family)